MPEQTIPTLTNCLITLAAKGSEPDLSAFIDILPRTFNHIGCACGRNCLPSNDEMEYLVDKLIDESKAMRYELPILALRFMLICRPR